MKTTITKEQALIACADHWNLLNHRPFLGKAEAARRLWPGLQQLRNFCWCCQFAWDPKRRQVRCWRCPMWPSKSWNSVWCLCESVDSLYWKWRTAPSYVAEAKHAAAIRDLALQKLEELWEGSPL